jgi:hypothetical protein
VKELEKKNENQLILLLIQKVWGCDIIVDWADPQEEPDEGTMSKVKVLYVRNLTHDISEEKLKVCGPAADLKSPIFFFNVFFCDFRSILKITAGWNVLRKLKIMHLCITRIVIMRYWQ